MHAGVNFHSSPKVPCEVGDKKGPPGALGDISYENGNEAVSRVSVMAWSCHRVVEVLQQPVLIWPSALRSRGEMKPSASVQIMAARGFPPLLPKPRCPSWRWLYGGTRCLNIWPLKSSPAPTMPGWVSSALTWARQPALFKLQGPPVHLPRKKLKGCVW